MTQFSGSSYKQNAPSQNLGMRLVFWLFAISLFYAYSPVDFAGGAEIFPWYLPLIAAHLRSLGQIILDLFVLALSIIFAASNAAVGVLILQTYGAWRIWGYMFALTTSERTHFFRILDKVVFCVAGMLVTVMLFPNSAGALLSEATFRAGEVVDHRTGGYSLFAPEPSYLAFSVFSVWLMYYVLKPERRTLPMALLIAVAWFTGSITGTIWCLVSISVVTLQWLKNSNKKNIALFFVFTPLLGWSFVSAYSAFYSETQSGLSRFILFLSEIDINDFVESVLISEERLGSARISEIFDAFRLETGILFLGEFNKPFSSFGSFASFIGPFHYLFLLAIPFISYAKVGILDRLFFTSVFIFGAPISFCGSGLMPFLLTSNKRCPR